MLPLTGTSRTFVCISGQQKLLAAPYAGPYQVLTKGAKTFTIQVGKGQDIVSVDRQKVHIGFGLVFPAEAASCGRLLKKPSAPTVQPAISFHEAADWGAMW